MSVGQKLSLLSMKTMAVEQKLSLLSMKAMAVGQKMPDPAIGSVKDPEPSDDDADDDNEFNPSDADIDKMATSYAQGA